jgi:hypothetical protein
MGSAEPQQWNAAHFQMQAAGLPRSAKRHFHLQQKPDPASRSQGPGAVCQGGVAEEHPRRQRRPRGHVQRRGEGRDAGLRYRDAEELPSVINETKLSRNKSDTYVQTAIIFAGALMVRIQSSSPNRDLAKKALAEFLDVMRIEEGPPAPPPGSPPQRGT